MREYHRGAIKTNTKKFGLPWKLIPRSPFQWPATSARDASESPIRTFPYNHHHANPGSSNTASQSRALRGEFLTEIHRVLPDLIC